MLGAITAFRSLVTSIEGTVDPTRQLAIMTESLKDVAGVFEKFGAAVATNEGQHNLFEQYMNQQIGMNNQIQQQVHHQSTLIAQHNQHNQQTTKQIFDLKKELASVQSAQAASNTTTQSATNPTRRLLCESRSISNLKVLGSRKEDFKNWNEKLINATTQTFGPEWRSFVRCLNERLDLDRKVLSDAEITQIPHVRSVPEPRKCNEELYYVMVEKTEGDAALRVNSGQPGEGLQAYMRVYLWFAGTTGLALTEKTRMLMHPAAPKHDYEIADALEKWSEQERTLRAHGKNYELNVAFKITALKILMSCKREQFETMERESKARHGDAISEAMFEDLLGRIKEYAQQRRLEESLRKARGDPMDIGSLNQPQSHNTNDDWNNQGEWSESDWQAWNQSEQWQNNQVDGVNKGKGKGKSKGKGKAKGKGQYSPYQLGIMDEYSMWDGHEWPTTDRIRDQE